MNPRKLSVQEEHEVRLFRESGVSIDRCAKLFEVSHTTIYRALRNQRRKFGLEKLPNGQSARAHLTGHANSNSQPAE